MQKIKERGSRILISDRTDFKAKKGIRDKIGHS